MSRSPIVHYKRSIRLNGYDYSKDGAYFITVCTKDKNEWLAKPMCKNVSLTSEGVIVKAVWDELSEHFNDIKLDKFIIMPDHVHGIIIIKKSKERRRLMEGKNCRGLINQTPTSSDFGHGKNKHGNDWILMQEPSIPLGKVIRFFKAKSCRIIRTSVNPIFKWQKNYYEHIIRNDEDLFLTRRYIINNPLEM